jgi:short subunit dehydrogenase-like uncharacterized protein
MNPGREGERDLSVIVFGATGVTGRRVAAYLAKRAEQGSFRWAAAGRDPAKVRAVLEEIGVVAPETIAADVGDPASLAAMAGRTAVVLDLVGPYTLYGEPVIAACIAAGAHYMDLTGETPFVRRMIDAKEQAAKQAGVKIVNTAGFEALPVDLAVLLATETARERWGEDAVSVDVDVDIPPPPGQRKLADMISGGTMQSGAEMLADPGAELIADPAALIADRDAAERVRQVSPIALAPRFNAEGEVIGPMMPGPFINPGVIHRTAALAAEEDGRAFTPFRYREGVALPAAVPKPLGYGLAAMSSGFQAGFRALSRARPGLRSRVAATMRRHLPGSGFGPSGEGLEAWSWTVAVHAVTSGGHHVRVDLDADGHPGYLATARMLGEAGLLLGEEGATPSRSGFLTPAIAIGTAGVERFEHAGMRLRVSS